MSRVGGEVREAVRDEMDGGGFGVDGFRLELLEGLGSRLVGWLVGCNGNRQS